MFLRCAFARVCVCAWAVCRVSYVEGVPVDVAVGLLFFGFCSGRHLQLDVVI